MFILAGQNMSVLQLYQYLYSFYIFTIGLQQNFQVKGHLGFNYWKEDKKINNNENRNRI
jgi:hypothetical protein